MVHMALTTPTFQLLRDVAMPSKAVMVDLAHTLEVFVVPGLYIPLVLPLCLAVLTSLKIVLSSLRRSSDEDQAVRMPRLSWLCTRLLIWSLQFSSALSLLLGWD
eukprot:5150194-Amphidinium_carterae.1